MTEEINPGDIKHANPLPPDVWVVVPAYNEGRRLGKTLESLLQVAQTVVVVDDGSTDDTGEVARRYPVWYLRHVVNLGAGAATQTGMSFAVAKGAEFVATFDADGQHRPEDLLTLFNTIQTTGANVVFGSRFIGSTVGMPKLRKVFLRFASFATFLMCGVWVTDVTTGLRMMDRKAASSIKITMNRFEHPIDFLQQVRTGGMRLVEAPATIVYTEESLRKGQRTAGIFRLALKIFAEEAFR